MDITKDKSRSNLRIGYPKHTQSSSQLDKLKSIDKKSVNSEFDEEDVVEYEMIDQLYEA